MAKYTINLLQDELIPEQPLLTLSRVITLWVAALVVMLAVMFTLQATEQSLAKQSQSLAQQKRVQDDALEQLQLRLTTHKPDPKLTAQLETLQTIIANKKSIYSYLTNSSESYINGFALAMSDLATIHSNNVSLTAISISDGHISFGGLARTAEAVPDWLTNFEQSKVLSGRLFNHFQLSENEQKIIEFTVSSSAQKEQD